MRHRLHWKFRESAPRLQLDVPGLVSPQFATDRGRNLATVGHRLARKMAARPTGTKFIHPATHAIMQAVSWFFYPDAARDGARQWKGR